MILLFLLCLCAHKGVSADEPTPLEPATYNHGALNGFYSMAYGISLSCVKDKQNELVKNVVSSFVKEKTNGDDGVDGAPMPSLQQNAIDVVMGLLVFPILGTLFALSCIIGMCVMCCVRGCCNGCGAKRYQKEDASPVCFFIGNGTILVSCVFILAGTIIYGQSVQTAFYTIKYEVQETAEGIVRGAEFFIADLRKNFEEVFNKVLLEPLKADIAMIQKSIENIFAEVKKEMGISEFLKGRSLTKYIQKQQETEKLAADQLAKLKTSFPVGLVAEQISQIENSFSDIKKATDELADAKTEDGTPLLSEDGIDRIRKRIDDVEENRMKSVRQMMEEATSNVDQMSAMVQRTIDETVQQFQATIDKVKPSVRKYTDNVKEYKKLSMIRSVVTSVGTAPSSLVLLFLFIGIFGGVARTIKLRTHPCERSSLSNCGGYCLLVGAYLIMYLAAMIMLIAVFVFAGSFVMSSVCKPLFVAPPPGGNEKFVTFDDNGGVTMNSINLGSFFEKCHDSSLFTLLEADKWVNKQIDEKMDLTQLKESVNTNMDGVKMDMPELKDSLKVLKEKLEKYREVTAEFAAMDTFFPADMLPEDSIGPDDEARKQVKETEEALGKVKQSVISLQEELDRDHAQLSKMEKRARTEAKDIITQRFKETIATFEKNTMNNAKAFVAKLSDPQTLPCRQLSVIYKNFGVLLCDKVARPINGIWMAVGMIAIFCIPSIVGILIVIRWLFKMNKKFYKTTGSDEKKPLLPPANNNKSNTNVTTSNKNEQSPGPAVATPSNPSVPQNETKPSGSLKSTSQKQLIPTNADPKAPASLKSDKSGGRITPKSAGQE